MQTQVPLLKGTLTRKSLPQRMNFVNCSRYNSPRDCPSNVVLVVCFNSIAYDSRKFNVAIQ